MNIFYIDSYLHESWWLGQVKQAHIKVLSTILNWNHIEPNSFWNCQNNWDQPNGCHFQSFLQGNANALDTTPGGHSSIPLKKEKKPWQVDNFSFKIFYNSKKVSLSLSVKYQSSHGNFCLKRSSCFVCLGAHAHFMVPFSFVKNVNCYYIQKINAYIFAKY